MFATAPIQSTVVEVQVMRISFNALCRYCRDGRRATMGVRSVDVLGHPMADLNFCAGHAAQLVQRAMMKNLEVSTQDRIPVERPA
jgi:hypothetical protein